jgi:hypothetical protein
MEETRTGRAPKPSRSRPTDTVADESFFSPRSYAPVPFVPECAVCGKEAFGANFLKFVEGGGLGTSAWVAEFHCKEHQAAVPAMLCANLSQWRVLSRTGRGIYGLRKLSEDEQNLRVLKAREAREKR